jgi:hypothetical protein
MTPQPFPELYGPLEPPAPVERASEERSEDDGMPEHPRKSADPAAWARRSVDP